MTYRVRMTECAVEQMQQSAAYISRVLLEPVSAMRWAEKMKKEIESLNELPLRFPLTDEEPWRSNGVRKMPVGNFLVYYWVSEEERAVWVISVLYGRRDQLSALKNVPME